MMFEISVNGKIFSNWKTAVVTRTIDENAGKFQFSSSNVVPADYPVRAGDLVQILINGEAKVTGYCDTLSSQVDNGTDTITVAGRDNIADLIDSSMPDTVKSIEGPLSLQALCEKVISALGANIEVVNLVPSITEFSELDFFGSDAGRNCMTFLTNFARKRQVYLIPDGAGRMEIFRPDEIISPGFLLNSKTRSGNNIKSSSVQFNHAERFGVYSSRSQDNFGFDPDADYVDGVDRSGQELDDQIRSSRFIEIQGEESMTDDESVNRALEELNIRRARSTSYTCSVAGVERSPGVVWDIGQLTVVRDDGAGIIGIFINRSVVYSADRNAGTVCTITVAPPEAYNVRKSTQGDSRRAQQGGALQTQQPPTPGKRFVR